MMTFHQIFRKLAVIDAAFFTDTVKYISLLQYRVARVFLIGKNIGDSNIVPLFARFCENASAIQIIGNLILTTAVKVFPKNFFYYLSFIGNDFRLAVGTLPDLKLWRIPQDTFLLIDSDSA